MMLRALPVLAVALACAACAPGKLVERVTVLEQRNDQLTTRTTSLEKKMTRMEALVDEVEAAKAYTREVADYLAGHLASRGRYTFEHTSMLLFGRLAAERRRDFRIAEVAVPYTYADAKSSIRLKDNLQLTWAAIYHAAALARLQR